ncbi:hypothetical protein L7F22_062846 [Adiantum nelumboides]|nr:hypothetical protein [Adiantum nelumboides]
MHKNQLQELAQRSSFNLPAYSCIREGPDHAPRFKATVNFNGELFESLKFFSTLRQAEHAAAEVALNVLLERGSSQLLAAKVLDETGMCKNLLQETAQRAGVSLPVYFTSKEVEGHIPIFSCTVEVGGRIFAGEPAKSKKQAEKNAAMVAWSSIRQFTDPLKKSDCKGSSITENFGSDSSAATALAPQPHKRDGRAHSLSRFHGGRSWVRMVNVRERSRGNRELSPMEQFLQKGDFFAFSPAREGTYESRRFLFNQQPSSTSRDLSSSGSTHERRHFEGSLSLPPPSKKSYDSQRFLFNQQPHVKGSELARSGGSTHQKSQSFTDLAFESSTFLPHDRLGSTSGGVYLGNVPMPQQHQPRASRLSLQSSSDRIELRRPLGEEFQQQEIYGDSDLFSALGGTTSTYARPQQYDQQYESANMVLQNRRAQSERFELKPSLFDELYRRDEEEWWSRGEKLNLERERVAAHDSCRDMGKYMFYDVGKGALETTSHLSGYCDEPGSVGSPYKSTYKLDANAPYVGFSSSACQRGSSPQCNEDSNAPASLYTAFSTDSQGVDGVGSYGNFNVDPTETSFFSNEALEETFLGHCNPASGSSGNTERTTSSSMLRWKDSARWSSSQPSSPSSTAAHQWNFRTLSLPPPTRVHQMVAVCSAPPSQTICVESNAVTNMAKPSLLHHGAPSIKHTSDHHTGLVSSTSDLLQQLRLE